MEHLTYCYCMLKDQKRIVEQQEITQGCCLGFVLTVTYVQEG